jgi:hypothetical protein
LPWYNQTLFVKNEMFRYLLLCHFASDVGVIGQVWLLR